MTRSRLWTLGTFGVVLAVFLAGWFLLIGPKRTEAADLRQQADDVAAENVRTQGRIKQLEADQKDLPAQIAKIATIKEQIPDDPRLPALIRSLVRAENAHGIELVSISPGGLTELSGVTGVRFIPVTVTVNGQYHELTKFLAQLEPRDADLKDRALLVTGFGVKEAPTDEDPDLLSLDVQARVFTSADVTASTTTTGTGTTGTGSTAAGAGDATTTTAN